MQNENCNFRISPGTRCEKMAHVREYPHESSCGRPSSRTNFSFRDRTFVRWIQWFGWFRAVAQLVHSIQMDLQAFFFRFGLRWCQLIDVCWTLVSGMQDGFFEPVAAVDGNRFISIWQWTWFCVLRVGRAVHQLSFVDVTVFIRKQSEKREVRNFSTTTQQDHPKQLIPNSANYEARLTDRSRLHTPSATRAHDINSSIEQKLQFSICKTTRRFAGPSLLSCGLKPSLTKICIRISFCKTSLIYSRMLRLHNYRVWLSFLCLTAGTL